MSISIRPGFDQHVHRSALPNIGKERSCSILSFLLSFPQSKFRRSWIRVCFLKTLRWLHLFSMQNVQAEWNILKNVSTSSVVVLHMVFRKHQHAVVGHLCYSSNPLWVYEEVIWASGEQTVRTCQHSATVWTDCAKMTWCLFFFFFFHEYVNAAVKAMRALKES